MKDLHVPQPVKGLNQFIRDSHNEEGTSFTWLYLDGPVAVDPTRWLKDDYTFVYTATSQMSVPGSRLSKGDVGGLLQTCMDNREEVARQASSLMVTIYDADNDMSHMLVGELRATEDTYRLTNPNLLFHIFVDPDIDIEETQP